MVHLINGLARPPGAWEAEGSIGKKFHRCFPPLSDLSCNYAVASLAVINRSRDAACEMQADSLQSMWVMNPTYYTVTRFLWSVALKCEV